MNYITVCMVDLFFGKHLSLKRFWKARHWIDKKLTSLCPYVNQNSHTSPLIGEYGYLSIDEKCCNVLPYVCITLGLRNLEEDICFSVWVLSHLGIHFNLLFLKFPSILSESQIQRWIWRFKDPFLLQLSLGESFYCPIRELSSSLTFPPPHLYPWGLSGSSFCLSWGIVLLPSKLCRENLKTAVAWQQGPDRNRESGSEQKKGGT